MFARTGRFSSRVYIYIYIYLEIIFGIYTRCQFFFIKVGRVNSSIRKIYILRPNRD